MKPEARLFVMGYDGKPCGPFRWTLVREWLALGYFAPDDKVRPADSVNWRPISTLPQLLAIPPGDEINDAVAQLRERAREKAPVGPRAVEYLTRLGCPVHFDRLNPHTAFHWVRILEELNPSHVDQVAHWAAEEEANGRTPPATPEHATASQIEALRSLGRNVPANLTWLEAQRLISGPPTESQLQRLKFYGIALPAGAGKDEAADLIDRHMRANWAAEEAYQAAERENQREAASPESRRPRLKLRESTVDAAVGIPLGAGRSSARSPDAIAVESRRGPRRNRRTVLAIVVAAAIASAAVIAFWTPLKQLAFGPSAPAHRGDKASDAKPAELVSVIEAPNQAAAERLRTFAASLKFTGIVATAEPSAFLNGVAYRVGDLIDPARRVVVVQIDAADQAIVLADGDGSLVKRRLR